MTKETHSLETVRRVYDDSEGVYIEVGPDADALDLVEIRTTNKESREFYGDFRLCLRPAQARLIAEALMLAANEVGQVEKKDGL